MLFKPCIMQGRPLFCLYSGKKRCFCFFLFLFSCTFVENLLLTALFVLSFVFSSQRQLTKTGRFLHNYFFFSTLVESNSCKREYGSTYASLLGRSDRKKPKYYAVVHFSVSSNLFSIIRTSLYAST